MMLIFHLAAAYRGMEEATGIGPPWPLACPARHGKAVSRLPGPLRFLGGVLSSRTFHASRQAIRLMKKRIIFRPVIFANASRSSFSMITASLLFSIGRRLLA